MKYHILKITAYSNEAIYWDCVVAFNGGYEKYLKELMWINGIST